MSNITKSATKLVLLFLVGVLGLLTVFVVVWSVIHDNISDLTTAIFAAFSGIVGVVVGYYFNNKGDQSQPFGGK